MSGDEEGLTRGLGEGMEWVGELTAGNVKKAIIFLSGPF